ncbi:MAG: hypothetical protein DSO00_08025 [Archaeoglobi archaeon]|nr:MAG: hypothetical protein DSO00_08025 [Archaeoglobi archaeon]
MKISYIQFLPKKEEVENSEVKYLAKRLKGKNDAETLTNILEWEDRNLRFWDDRLFIYTIVTGIVIFFVSVVLLFSGANHIFLVVIILPLILGLALSGTHLYVLVTLTSISLACLTIFAVITLSLEKLSVYSNFLRFIIALYLLTGASLSIIIYLVIKYKNMKEVIPETLINDIFTLSLPIEKILGYRLSVCRDYAKLTMALLLNLYPSCELYFIEIPRHVATAVKLNKTIYVLDQHLPISSLKNWVLFWKNGLRKRKLEPLLLMVGKNRGIKIMKTKKFKDDCLECDINSTLSKMILAEITNNLKKELVNRGLIKYSEEFRLLLIKNFVMRLEDDEIVKYSLLRLVKRKIEDELCSRVQDIVDINLQIEKNDLVLRVKLEGEKSE